MGPIGLILVLILLVGVLVAGYYLGIVMAVVTAAICFAGAAIVVVFFIGYTIYDGLNEWKRRREERRRDT